VTTAASWPGRSTLRSRGPRRLARVAERQPDRDQPDRDVDEEDRSPSKRRDQRAAADRAAGQADRRAGGPHPNRPSALARLRIGVVEQDQRARDQHRGAQTLHGPGPDQDRERRRQAAEPGGGCEHCEPGDEHPPRSDPVAESPGRQDERGEHDRVGADDPLQGRDTAAERVADWSDRHVDHADVELDHAEAEAHRDDRR
jgi:hypothetical protein